jgi:hypothetical protein
MSLPVAMAPALAVVNPIDGLLHLFNSNPYFIGIMMLVLNLGGRFIGMEITKKQEEFLQHPWVRRLLIFTVLFVGTRNIQIAFWSTVVVVLILGYLFNENSALCLFGKGGAQGATCSVKEDMTPEEKEILHRLQSKAQRFSSMKKVSDSEEDVLHTDIYAANMALLNQPMK